MIATLRQANSTDAARIADILIGTRSSFMLYAPSVHSEAEVRDWVHTHLIPTGGVTVAERKEEVVGLVAVSTDGNYQWIDQMSVHPLLVGHGIGARLLKYVVATSTLPIRLYTFQANLDARRFYERHGFLAVEFTDGQANEERCPDVLYERAITPKAGG
jgi:N-acetylglutamate synthase-like GNAT family acetyltransferase